MGCFPPRVLVPGVNVLNRFLAIDANFRLNRRGHTDRETAERAWANIMPYHGGREMKAGARGACPDDGAWAWTRRQPYGLPKFTLLSRPRPMAPFDDVCLAWQRHAHKITSINRQSFMEELELQTHEAEERRRRHMFRIKAHAMALSWQEQVAQHACDRADDRQRLLELMQVASRLDHTTLQLGFLHPGEDDQHIRRLKRRRQKFFVFYDICCQYGQNVLASRKQGLIRSHSRFQGSHGQINSASLPIFGLHSSPWKAAVVYKALPRSHSTFQCDSRTS
ncbi:hypothetical protein C8R44DRAFT_858672 [Mycena epipterygia]|nr:hypothetical protein C8R44DRAFT_858672 [Mycena epipterygia]